MEHRSAKEIAAVIDWDCFDRVFSGYASAADIFEMESVGLLTIYEGEDQDGRPCWGSALVDIDAVLALRPTHILSGEPPGPWQWWSGCTGVGNDKSVTLDERLFLAIKSGAAFHRNSVIECTAHDLPPPQHKRNLP